MKLIIDIPKEEYDECKRQVDMIKQEGVLIESLNTALKIHVANGMIPGEIKPDEWCTDCKEYDHGRHCCPRYNRVIKRIIKNFTPALLRDIKEELDERSEMLSDGEIYIKNYDMTKIIYQKIKEYE